MLKVCEIYQSIQGEGPHVGEPTTFLRFGGCNLRCPGWPCDSLFAVLPEYNDSWEHAEGGTVLNRIPVEPRRVCLTGGEPLIQPADALTKLVDKLVDKGHLIDLFTNGTKELPNWTRWWQVTAIVDWKLKGSGNGDNFLTRNLDRMKSGDHIKFTIASREDYIEALGLISKYGLLMPSSPRVIIGTAWKEFTEAELVELMLRDLPSGLVRLNSQLHKYIWPPMERGR